MSGKIRQFSTGATRDTDENKIDYTGILSPLFLVRFGEYMRKHSIQPDGTRRSYHNWKLGIPITEFPKSGSRHFVDWLLELEGFKGREDIEEACCALFFNIQGFMHEKIKREGNVRNKQLMEQLIKQSKIAKSSRTCWATELKGDAKEYIGILMDTMGEEEPVFARVCEILSKEFGLKVSRSAVINHFRGECRCVKEKKTKSAKK